MFLAPAIKNCQGSFEVILEYTGYNPALILAPLMILVNDIKSISWFFPGFHLFVLVFKKTKTKNYSHLKISLHKS